MDIIFGEQDVSRELDTELALLAEAESNYVVRPDQLAEKIIARKLEGPGQRGLSLPWSKADEIIKIRGGELSVWGGINGHGKSLLLGQIMLEMMRTQKVLIVSLELFPDQTLERMIDQMAGCYSSPDYVRAATEELRNKLWIYDQVSTVKSKKIIALIHYAKKTLGVDHIVIDSMTKCGLPDDYGAEKNFMDELQWSAKNLNVHIHLVCHIRKGESEQKIPNKFDVIGSSAITNIPDNIFIVWRNKRKEEIKKELDLSQRKGSNYTVSPADEKCLDMPDTILSVEKNRHGGEEGKIGLYYHKLSGQSIPTDNGRAMPSPIPVTVRRVA